MVAQDGRVVLAGVGAAAVRVMEDASLGPPCVDGVIERLKDQVVVVGGSTATLLFRAALPVRAGHFNDGKIRVLSQRSAEIRLGRRSLIGPER